MNCGTGEVERQVDWRCTGESLLPKAAGPFEPVAFQSLPLPRCKIGILNREVGQAGNCSAYSCVVQCGYLTIENMKRSAFEYDMRSVMEKDVLVVRKPEQSGSE